MTRIFEIYADEAWTHGGNPPHRYWCFLGGIFGTQPDLDKLDTDLRQIIGKYGINGEVKWSKISEQNIDCYIDLVNCFMAHVNQGRVKYRQTFLDRSYKWLPRHGEIPLTELEVQFRIYYQFLKHSFGLRYLPNPTGSLVKILIHLDDHSSNSEKEGLRRFASNLPAQLDRPELDVQVSFLNSAKNMRLQICDLMMGAAGSHGNKMRLRRKPGKRGQTPKQRVRDRFCRHVYNMLRQQDAAERGSRAFNWFETTGHDGDIANRFHHAVRIWKFEPKRYIKDRGWENDNLDNQGHYMGPILD